MAEETSPKGSQENRKNQNNHEIVYASFLNVFATTILMIEESCRAEALLNPPLPSLCAEGLAARILPPSLVRMLVYSKDTAWIRTSSVSGL